MVIRGLGCAVRFVLTAGQKGDAPQASAFVEELPAGQAIAAKTAIPNNPCLAISTGMLLQ
jgi:hypothetical protein